MIDATLFVYFEWRESLSTVSTWKLSVRPQFEMSELPEEQVDIEALLDLSQKKKKKKKKVTADAGGEEAATEATSATPVESNAPPSYTYAQLLERVNDLLHQHNPEQAERRRYTIKPPQLMKGV